LCKIIALNEIDSRRRREKKEWRTKRKHAAFNAAKEMRRLIMVFKNQNQLLILSLILPFILCSPTGPKPPQISLSVFPINGGTIIANPTSYTIGDNIKLEAQPFAGHFFYKWYGDIASSDSIINFTVKTDSKYFCAIFPDTLIADSQVIIGNFPNHILNKGESAEFDLALNLPLDSTYTVYGACLKYDNFSFVMNAHGNDVNIKVGCENDSATIQTVWWIRVKSDKSDTFIVKEQLNYSVQWQ
jgi:hypothetical protein